MEKGNCDAQELFVGVLGGSLLHYFVDLDTHSSTLYPQLRVSWPIVGGTMPDVRQLTQGSLGVYVLRWKTVLMYLMKCVLMTRGRMIQNVT